MRNNTIGADLTQGSIIPVLIRFSIPFMLANLLQVAYNTIDTIVIGQFVGSAGVSAVSNGGDLIHLFTMFIMGFSSAGQIIISQYAGMKDDRRKAQAIGTLLSVVALLSVGTMLAGLAMTGWVVRLLRVPGEAARQAVVYSMVCFCGMPFIGGYNLFASILRGMGASKRPFVIIATAALTNLLLDLLFVAAFRLGAFGTALATVISQGISFAFALFYLYRRREQFGFDFQWKSFRIEGSMCRVLFRLGIPMALQHCAVLVSKLFVTSYINSYGVTVSAVNGIGNKLGRIPSVITQSLSTAATSMIGQNFGAGKKDRVSRTVYACLLISFACTLVLAVLVLLFPVPIFSAFTTDPEVVAMGAEVYLYIAAFECIAGGLRSPVMALVNGIGNSGLALATGLADGVFARILLAITLGIYCHMGILGFWIGGAMASFVPFLIGGIYFWTGLWKKYKAIDA